MNPTTILFRTRLAEDLELRARLIAHIEKRIDPQHLLPDAKERAKAIFASLSEPDVILLELEARRTAPAFTAEYDPFAR